MGYDTQFTGQVAIDPPLNPQEIAYLREFAQSRRMNRPAGPYATTDDDYFDGYNDPPAGQPGLWCDFEPTSGGTAIAWNRTENFYSATEWMQYVIDHFLRPGGKAQGKPGFEGFTFDHAVNGTIHAEGDDEGDVWDLVVTDNQAASRPAVAEDVIHAETDGNTDTITLKAVEHGESTIVIDRAEYEDAKRTHTLDLLLDAHLSDMDSSTVVFEPDGTKVDPYA